MANMLDEMEGPFNQEGQDIKVINKRIEVKVGTGSKVFEIFLWLMLILPGLIFAIKKVSARNYFSKLEQRIQSAASEVDNYLEQRFQILQNVASLLEKSVNLDKDVMKGVAALRSGGKFDAEKSSEMSLKLDNAYKQINLAFENYPNLKSQETIISAMQKNDYTQREISASRNNYNDYVSRWNQDIQVWPTKKIVAAKQGYTTRIPFTASVEVKQKARENFF